MSEQETLEKKIGELRENAAKINVALRQKESLDQKLAALREAFAKNRDALSDARKNAEGADQLAVLQGRETAVGNDLARLRATLERDEKFQSEVRNGLCPILSEKCLNLKEGQTLKAFFDPVRRTTADIKTLEAEQARLSVRVKVSREAEYCKDRPA